MMGLTDIVNGGYDITQLGIYPVFETTSCSYSNLVLRIIPYTKYLPDVQQGTHRGNRLFA